MKIKKILACIDVSEYGTSVIRFSAYVAKKVSAELAGLHVIDVMQLEGPFMYDISGALGLEPFVDFSGKIRAVLEEKANNVLASFAEIASRYGVRFSSKIETGIVSKVILSHAGEYDLVFIGKKGVNEQYDRGILGTNIESVLRKVPKPLFIVPKHFFTFSTIVVCVDGKEVSKKALSYGKQFADIFNVDLKTVYVRKKQEMPDLPGDVDILDGSNVVSALYNYIKLQDKPLVCMGAYSRAKILEIILGSTTENLLKKDLEAPFLIIR